MNEPTEKAVQLIEQVVYELPGGTQLHSKIISEPVFLARGYSVAFVSDGTFYDCRWSPKVPSQKTCLRIKGKLYVEKRDAFLNRVYELTGKKISVIDL